MTVFRNFEDIMVFRFKRWWWIFVLKVECPGVSNIGLRSCFNDVVELCKISRIPQANMKMLVELWDKIAMKTSRYQA